MGNFFYIYQFNQLLESPISGQIQTVTDDGSFVVVAQNNTRHITIYHITNKNIDSRTIELQFQPVVRKRQYIYEEETNIRNTLLQAVTNDLQISVFVVAKDQKRRMAKIIAEKSLKRHRVEYYENRGEIMEISYASANHALLVADKDGFNELGSHQNSTIQFILPETPSIENIKLFSYGNQTYIFIGIEEEVFDSEEITINKQDKTKQIKIVGKIQALDFNKDSKIFGLRIRSVKNNLRSLFLNENLQKLSQDGLQTQKYSFHKFSHKYNTVMVIQELKNIIQEICLIPFSIQERLIYFNLGPQRNCADTYLQNEYRVGEFETDDGIQLFSFQEKAIKFYDFEKERKDQYVEFNFTNVQVFSVSKKNRIIAQTGKNTLQVHELQKIFNIWVFIGFSLAIFLIGFVIICYVCSKKKKEEGEEQQEEDKHTSRNLRIKKVGSVKRKCELCQEVNRRCSRNLPCGHSFHSKCFKEKIREDFLCPVCLKPYKLPSVKE